VEERAEYSALEVARLSILSGLFRVKETAESRGVRVRGMGRLHLPLFTERNRDGLLPIGHDGPAAGAAVELAVLEFVENPFD